MLSGKRFCKAALAHAQVLSLATRDPQELRASASVDLKNIGHGPTNTSTQLLGLANATMHFSWSSLPEDCCAFSEIRAGESLPLLIQASPVFDPESETTVNFPNELLLGGRNVIAAFIAQCTWYWEKV